MASPQFWRFRQWMDSWPALPFLATKAVNMPAKFCGRANPYRERKFLPRADCCRTSDLLEPDARLIPEPTGEWPSLAKHYRTSRFPDDRAPLLLPNAVDWCRQIAAPGEAGASRLAPGIPRLLDRQWPFARLPRLRPGCASQSRAARAIHHRASRFFCESRRRVRSPIPRWPLRAVARV